MKKIHLIFIFMIISMAFFLNSCNEEKPEISNPKPDSPKEDAETDFMDIGELDFKLVYDKYQLGNDDIVESFADKFEDETGVKLDVLEYKNSGSSEYRILFGGIESNLNSKKETNELKELTNLTSSAFSIKFVGKDLLVASTGTAALEEATKLLLSYVKDGKLLLSSEHSDKYVVLPDNSGNILINASEMASTALLSEIRIAGAKLGEFSPSESEFTVKYPSVENHPKVSATPLNSKSYVNIGEVNNSGILEIKVTSEDGEKSKTYKINFKIDDGLLNVKSEIVNKDGKKGVVSFVFDDGIQRTADIVMSRLLPKYQSLRLSYALITEYLASVSEDDNGSYVISPIERPYISTISNSAIGSHQYAYEFWNEVLKYEGMELISHSHTHTADGVSDTPEFELKASQEILKKLCSQEALTYVKPGVGAVTNIDEYNELINSGEIYIGARGSKNTPWAYTDMLNFADTFNRYSVYSLAVNRYATKLNLNTDANNDYTTNENSDYETCMKAGIPVWTDYIDAAADNGAWACYCIHNVVLDSEKVNHKWFIYESQLDKLFAHAQKLSDEGDIWIANYTEAQKYYNEWSSAKLETVLDSDKSVTVKLTDEEDNAIYNTALTVKVPVPKTWSSAKLSYDGKTETLEVLSNEDGTKFVYINMIPDSENAVIEGN